MPKPVAVNPLSRKRIYLGGAGILVSRNKGASWRDIVIKRDQYGTPALSVSDISNRCWRQFAHLVVADEATGMGVVYRGDESGRHWTRIKSLANVAKVVPDERDRRLHSLRCTIREEPQFSARSFVRLTEGSIGRRSEGFQGRILSHLSSSL